MNRINTIFKGTLGILFLVGTICNVYLSYRAYSVVKSNSVQSVTNVVELLSSPLTNSSPSGVKSSFSSPFYHSPLSDPRQDIVVPKEVAEYPYQYFLIGRRIGVQLFGRFYYEGSPCSYGRIKHIFPDRIILEDGNWIRNRIDYQPQSFHERITKNDAR